ncbi:MAG: 4a-hydroxytetrahydrobiopterin dehydratase [Deltaproteobacteria bacterium]|nr:4a-hydroxytetrahydrobiopterin dehydratase [Deltaproteobacteria bacterium]
MTASRSRLSDEEVTTQLADLPGWSVEDGKLTRHYRFQDFIAAVGFMTQVAIEAEQLDHHPNWSNVYNRVDVTLWTHDAGGLTALDVKLARAMERRAGAAVTD